MHLHPLPRRTHLRQWLALPAAALAGLFAGCATTAGADRRASVKALLRDEALAPLPPVPTLEAVAASSPAMQAHLRTELDGVLRAAEPRRALVERLHQQGRLRLAYDSSLTRTAAEAFEAGVGNCLSLVLMTASFARLLGMPVRFQSVDVPEQYTLGGGLTLASGHINLVLGPARATMALGRAASGLRDLHDELVVDFLPPAELLGLSARPLAESTVLAMYFNNRAAELLVNPPPSPRPLAWAYAHARAALEVDPGFLSAVNTLAVILDRAGLPQAAEEAFRHVLADAAGHVGALHNLSGLLMRQGRSAEAAPLQARLQRLQPEAPFEAYHQGRRALAEGRTAEALDWFHRELRQQPFQDEVHFWAAQAQLRLGQPTRAAQHLQQAQQGSRTVADRDRYAAKLAWLRARIPPTP